MKSIILLITFFINLGHAQTDIHTSADAPKEKQKEFSQDEFKPHMIDHFNEGCPANSECSPEMGKLHKRWVDNLTNFSKEKDGWRLLDRFRKTNGVPFEVWSTEKALAKENIIFWDSPCRDHNQEGKPKISIGIVIVNHLKKLKELVDNKKVYLRFLKIYQGKGKPAKSYMTLRGDNPLYIEDNKLIYQRLEEGHYYGLSVAQSGELNIVATKSPPEFPQSIECPKELVDELKSDPNPENLYAGIYCQKTWNMTKKDFDILMVGWSCN